jgi:DNA polymerase-3 subunit beta
MKAICSKERLTKALSIAESVISTKNSISILSNVLIEARSGSIRISACETRLSFFTEIGADIQEEGSASVYCNKLYSIVRKLPGDDIEISIDNNNQFMIKPSGKDNIFFMLKGIDAEKFPPIKSVDDINFFSLPQDVYMDMTKKTIFAISMSESRRFVSGLYFEKADDSIRMVATDGKRLSFIKKAVPFNQEVESGIIIPPKIITESLKLCSGNGDIQIALDSRNIYISIDNFYFISNLLEGNFPPYEKVMPEGDSQQLSVNRKQFFDTLDRISQIGDKESHKIIISLQGNSMEIFTEDIAHGSGKETIAIENYTGEDVKIALNYQFLTDVLNVVKSEKVLLEFKDAQNTVTVKEDGNSEYIYIMMPMSF